MVHVHGQKSPAAANTGPPPPRCPRLLPARHIVRILRARQRARDRKMNALCFDIDANSSCRNPLKLTLIQTTRGCTPSLCIFFAFHELQTASPGFHGSLDRPGQPHSSDFLIERIQIQKYGMAKIAGHGNSISRLSCTPDRATPCAEAISLSVAASGFPCCVAAKATHRMPLSKGQGRDHPGGAWRPM
jgi:hypothetical protein